MKWTLLIMGMIVMTTLVNAQTFTKDDYIKLNHTRDTGVTKWEINNPENTRTMTFLDLLNATRDPVTNISPLDFAFSVRKGAIKRTDFYIETQVPEPIIMTRYGPSTTTLSVSNLRLYNLTHIQYDLAGTNWIIDLNDPRLDSYNILRQQVISNNLETYQNGTRLVTKQIPLDTKTFSLNPKAKSYLVVDIEPKLGKLSNGWGYSINYNPWFNTTFQKRINITLNNSRSTENLTNFQVLIKLNNSIIDYADTQNNGEDIRFVDDDESTLLDHEIEVWNESGESFIWVEVPQINASSEVDFIQMYYDCSTCSDGQDVDGTWDDGTYNITAHMNQDPSGTAPQMIDSSAPRRNGTTAGSMTSTDLVDTGRLYLGLEFDGSNDEIDWTSSTIPITTTFEFWGEITADIGDIIRIQSGLNPLFTWRHTATDQISLTAVYDGGGADFFSFQMTTAAADENSFLYFAGIVNGSSTALADQRIYINGTSQALTQTDTPSGTTMLTSSSSWGIPDGSNDIQMTMGELRISNNIRSSEWIEANYHNFIQNIQIYGSVENVPSGPAAGNACTLANVVNCNCTLNSTLTVTSGDLTINGNGESINFTNDADLVFTGSSQYLNIQNRNINIASGSEIR